MNTSESIDRFPLPEIPPHSEFFGQRNTHVFFKWPRDGRGITYLNSEDILPEERKIISAVASMEWEMFAAKIEFASAEHDNGIKRAVGWRDWGGWNQ